MKRYLTRKFEFLGYFYSLRMEITQSIFHVKKKVKFFNSSPVCLAGLDPPFLNGHRLPSDQVTILILSLQQREVRANVKSLKSEKKRNSNFPPFCFGPTWAADWLESCKTKRVIHEMKTELTEEPWPQRDIYGPDEVVVPHLAQVVRVPVNRPVAR